MKCPLFLAIRGFPDVHSPSAAPSNRGEACIVFVAIFTFLCYAVIGSEPGTGDVSPASWKRVTHFDSYRITVNCPVSAAASFAADGGSTIVAFI